jgi:hypothetical protein
VRRVLEGMGRRKDIHTPEFSDRRCARAAYVHWSSLFWMTASFCGVSPAVPAVVVHLFYRFAKLGTDNWLQGWLRLLAPSQRSKSKRRCCSSAGILGILCFGSGFREGARQFRCSSAPVRKSARQRRQRRKSRGLVQSESKRSIALRRDPNRIPNPPADTGTGARAKVASESENRRED